MGYRLRLECGVWCRYLSKTGCSDHYLLRQHRGLGQQKEAADFYLRAIAGSEGSECERYTKIYTELLMGKEVCTDE